jgi:hypothetical protein
LRSEAIVNKLQLIKTAMAKNRLGMPSGMNPETRKTQDDEDDHSNRLIGLFQKRSSGLPKNPRKLSARNVKGIP